MTTEEKKKTEILAINVDGKLIVAKPGQTVIQAAQDAGIYIPYLCYHPGMDPYGACRMCVVETEINGRKMIQASCTVPVANDMIVSTETPVIKELRKGIMDLLMSEHPHGCLTCHRIELCGPQDVCQRHVSVTDRCTTCPKNERCELKDTIRDTQMELTTPLTYNRRQMPIHTKDPFYDRDYNLCIVCVRCVRVCDEIRFDNAIALKSRSGVAMVGTAKGTSLLESGCEFCGACIDVCPTGALVERDYKWEKAAKKTKTICANCPIGCQLIMETNNNDKSIRMIGDYAGEANGGQTCYRGKFGNDYVNKRTVGYPMIQNDDNKNRSNWEEVNFQIAEKISKYSPGEIAILNSPRSTNEDYFVSQKFSRIVLGTNNIDCVNKDNIHDYCSESLGYPSGTGIIMDLEYSKNVVIISGNPTEQQNVLSVYAKKGARNGANVVVIDPRETEMTRYANQWIRSSPNSHSNVISSISKAVFDLRYEDTEFIKDNVIGIDEFKSSLWDFDLEKIKNDFDIKPTLIQELAKNISSGETSFIFGLDGISDEQGLELVKSVSNLAIITGNLDKKGAGLFPLYKGANLQGSFDMGSSPDFLPGFRSVQNKKDVEFLNKYWDVNLSTEKGLGYGEIIQGIKEERIKCLIVMSDGISNGSMTQDNIDIISKIPFLVVGGSINNDLTELADVVIPICNFPEREGTMTNIERRVQHSPKAYNPKKEAKNVWEFYSNLAQTMGAKDFDYSSAKDVFQEIKSIVKEYQDIDYSSLVDGGRIWNPENRILNLLPNKYFSTNNLNKVSSDFLLLQGRVLIQTEREVSITQKDNKHILNSVKLIRMHPEDAKNLNLDEGELVRVTDEQLNSFDAKLETDFHLQGAISYTSLFGEMVTDISESQDDWAPNVPDLDFKFVKVKKAIKES